MVIVDNNRIDGDDSDYQIVPIHKKRLLTDDGIKALTELAEVVRKIEDRLLSEGYTIVDGKITKPKIVKF